MILRSSGNIKILGLLSITLLLSQCDKQNQPVTTDPVVPEPEPEINDPGAPAGYQLLWSDEFDGVTLDESIWNFETGTGVNGDFGTGQIDIATDREENVRIQQDVPGTKDGVLAITTTKESYGGRSYTSGRINTKGKQSWGPGHRLVVRAWPKGVRHKGQGFAFWLMPDELPAGENHLMWPQGGEVDIMEYVGSIPFANLASVHYAWRWENNQWTNGNHNHQGGYYSYEDEETPLVKPTYGNYPPDSTAEFAGSYGFHNYGVDWYDDRMEFFIDTTVYHVHYFEDGNISADDGEIKNTVDISGDHRIYNSEFSHHFDEWKPFEHKFFIILSAGVGGADHTYGGSIVPQAEFPCDVFIDYVKVYKLPE